MNNTTLTKTNGQGKMEMLFQAFNTFNETALKLNEYYQGLEQQVKSLNIELERKNRELEKNLEEKEQVKNYLHNILESLSTGVLVLDIKGRVTTRNRAFQKITNGRIKEVKDFISRQVGETKSGYLELKGKARNGCVLRLKRFPLIAANQETKGTVITLEDITRLKRLEEQVSRNSRLEAMGEMAVNIAHEIRNPLGSIELFASLLKRDFSKGDERRKLVEHIISGVKSLNQVISNTLLFTHTLIPNFQKVNLSSLLDEALVFSSHIVKENRIKVSKEYSPKNFLLLYADSALLKQLFLNLILNAVQAMPDGGYLKIATAVIRETIDNGNGRAQSEMLEIKIADTGMGMNRAVREKVFDPFFTTRQGGTGLGLTIAHRIIEAHGGTIGVESQPRKGTTFTLGLPLQSEKKTAETQRHRDIENGPKPDHR